MAGIDIRTLEIPNIASVGRLGATTSLEYPVSARIIAALDMAERRILRLEMALRRAGIEVEMTELPK